MKRVCDLIYTCDYHDYDYVCLRVPCDYLTLNY